MLNFSSNSDELRRARTTESTAAAAVMTQRQLQFGVRPRSSTGRDEAQEIPHSANSSARRMPDLQPRSTSTTTTRARGMSGGCVDALRRAIALEHERAEAATVAAKANKQQQRPRANTATTTWTTTRSSFQQKLRRDQIEMMETKRMMGRSSVSGNSKDRDLLMSSSSARRSGTMSERDPSEPNSEDDEDDEDEVVQELQMRPRTESLGFIPVDDHRALAAGATSYEHEHAYDPEFDLSDDDEDGDAEENDPGCYLVDTPELAAFLGLTIPQQQHQAYPPPMFPKAASFSGQHYSQYYQSQQSQPQSLRGMVPCSPPVPIPPKQMLRRRNSVTGSLLTTNPSSLSLRKYHGGDVLCDESNYSRTQCEARLWDEDWNFKLSLEARESFEASNNSKNNNNNNRNSNSSNSSANGRRAVWKSQSTSSMASTADTFRDEDEELIGSFGGMGVSGGENHNNNDSGDEDEDDADQVFDMDDL